MTLYLISGVILLLVISSGILNNLNRHEYVYNPELPFVKENCKGNLTLDKQFVNTNKKMAPPLAELLKWKLSKNPYKEEKRVDSFRLVVQPFSEAVNKHENKIVWLGHASFLISVNGINIVTDPSYESYMGVERKIQNSEFLERLRNIHYLLISHGHPDHFNKKSYSMLKSNNPMAEALTPMRFSSMLKNKDNYQEAAWFQKYKTKDGVEIVFMPAQHWHNRSGLDFNRALWGSFIIKTNDICIHFMGDTGFNEDFLAQIHALYPKIDICLAPIAPFEPESMMKKGHISPIEAIEACNFLHADKLIPMHFGTYDLGNEPLGLPLQTLMNNKEKFCGSVEVIEVGELYKLK